MFVIYFVMLRLDISETMLEMFPDKTE